VCWCSELKGNVSDLLGSALEAFDSDKMMSVIGAMAGLMATEDDDPDLRTDLLAFVANASTLQDVSTQFLISTSTVVLLVSDCN
jgi:hypothetical protein